MNNSEKVIKEFTALKNEAAAKHLARFFKTGKGQYGEGDLFLGIKVPITRALVKKHSAALNFDDIKTLIQNPYHEIRLAGFLALVDKFSRAKEEADKKEIFAFYTANLKNANNWDLVDLSCYKIAGVYLHNKNHAPLLKLARATNLWEQRVAMVSTMYFVKNGSYETTLALAEHFLTHKHDLMHKAAGWLLREVGKMDTKTLYGFLDKHYSRMPRTMLRYAIEKLPENKKKFYMAKP